MNVAPHAHGHRPYQSIAAMCGCAVTPGVAAGPSPWDFWSDPVASVALTAGGEAAPVALPDVVVDQLPVGDTILKVVAILIIPVLRDTSTADNGGCRCSNDGAAQGQRNNRDHKSCMRAHSLSRVGGPPENLPLTGQTTALSCGGLTDHAVIRPDGRPWKKEFSTTHHETHLGYDLPKPFTVHSFTYLTASTTSKRDEERSERKRTFI